VVLLTLVSGLVLSLLGHSGFFGVYVAFKRLCASCLTAVIDVVPNSHTILIQYYRYPWLPPPNLG
jgi:hypothetical protein